MYVRASFGQGFASSSSKTPSHDGDTLAVWLKIITAKLSFMCCVLNTYRHARGTTPFVLIKISKYIRAFLNINFKLQNINK